MTLRTRHGKATKHGIADALETLPVVEQPAGVPGQADDTSRAASAERGPFAEGNRRSVMGATLAQGQAPDGRADRAHAAERGPADEAPTTIAAKGLVHATTATLAMTVGGGQLDPHVGYLVTAAGRAAKWANYLSDVAERMAPGSKEQRETVIAALGADERASTHLRNAHEYAARMATLRDGQMTPAERQARALGRLGMPPVEDEAMSGATFETLMHLDAQLARHGVPPLGDWWKDVLGRWYHGAALTLGVCAGRGSAKSTALYKVAENETVFGDWTVPPGERHWANLTSRLTDEAAKGTAIIGQHLTMLGIRHASKSGVIELTDMPRGIRISAASVGGNSGWRSFFDGNDEGGKWATDGAMAADAVEVFASKRAMTATHANARHMTVGVAAHRRRAVLRSHPRGQQ